MIQALMSTTKYSYGDVILVNFPQANLRRYDRRPALIVQSDAARTEFNQRVIVQITSAGRTGPTRLAVTMSSPSEKSMGLRTDSYIVCDKIQTVNCARFEKIISQCPIMDEVQARLKLVLNLH